MNLQITYKTIIYTGETYIPARIPVSYVPDDKVTDIVERCRKMYAEKAGNNDMLDSDEIVIQVIK